MQSVEQQWQPQEQLGGRLVLLRKQSVVLLLVEFHQQLVAQDLRSRLLVIVL
jgi:hypothetical protein